MKRKDFLLDLRKKSVKDLVVLRKKMRLDYFNLRMKNASKWLKETHKILNLRRDIARINTVLSVKISESYGSDK